MSRITIGSRPSQESIASEIAHLENMPIADLKSRWQTAFRRKPPATLPRHLLVRTLAYQLQVELFGDLDSGVRRLLETSGTPHQAAKRAIAKAQQAIELRPGTVLGREWQGQMHRVSVLDDGFAWNGKTYDSLSRVALAITGTRWNGPRFFGLRADASFGAGK